MGLEAAWIDFAVGATVGSVIVFIAMRFRERIAFERGKADTQREVFPLTVAVAELRKELEKIRKTGLAISVGVAVPGAAGLAAPVFDTDGKAAAALLIGAPVDRFERELPSLRKLMKEVAAQASGLFAGPAR